MRNDNCTNALFIAAPMTVCGLPCQARTPELLLPVPLLQV
jgi:hypothetical protein